jgi:hypothetical protein
VDGELMAKKAPPASSVQRAVAPPASAISIPCKMPILLQDTSDARLRCLDSASVVGWIAAPEREFRYGECQAREIAPRRA